MSLLNLNLFIGLEFQLIILATALQIQIYLQNFKQINSEEICNSKNSQHFKNNILKKSFSVPHPSAHNATERERNDLKFIHK